jgi:hypothetical protein
VSLLWSYRWVQRKIVFELNWPSWVGFHVFNRLIYKYLAHHGWSINTPNVVAHVAVIKKSGQSIAIRCECGISDFTESKIHDLGEEAVTRRASVLVVITANEIPLHLQSSAAHKAVLILHYKKLRIFADRDINYRDALEAMRVARLERVAPAAQMADPA